MERNPSMDIEVKDPEKNDWVRIERVPASVMASGNAEDYQISHPGRHTPPGRASAGSSPQTCGPIPTNWQTIRDTTMCSTATESYSYDMRISARKAAKQTSC